ncbi:unnamed protein product [Bursaphelenchus okinawaensis]|uniref:Uncharacterized protein n=1 Tax=Bursaphelenchus okinawaensis TaxID=465554 RepID=A0A811L9Z0_9BILA|nr:unnamed protein product [Bursaphelenchus okinawaensis]CAG9119163.1 unnamed protein product [Bursaphelenchus okinawaensis]
MPSKLLLITLLALSVSYSYAQNDDDYDPQADDERSPQQKALGSTARNFTRRCWELSKYSGEKSCDVFNICCSTDNVLNRLNGDKCQTADPTNGCSVNAGGNEIQWAQCVAYNCTEEITTTTTTTQSPRYANASPVRYGTMIAVVTPLVALLHL